MALIKMRETTTRGSITGVTFTKGSVVVSVQTRTYICTNCTCRNSTHLAGALPHMNKDIRHSEPLFAMAKDWEPSKCSPKGDWLNTL